ncbi:MAG: DUF4270 family protein [Bacteroidia bacterium]|nr:DUF4270 family protein [Bacteroidia bacterium]
MVFFAACKDQTRTGLGILPDDDIVNALYLDTFSLEMQTIILDSTPTSKLNHVLFGNAIDPEFGRIDARAYLQFVLPSSKEVNFGDTSSITVDSVFLKLDLSDVYGRHNNPIRIQVYEITDDSFSDTVTYYSTDRLNLDTTIDLAHNYLVDFSDYAGFFDISIPLDLSLGKKIIFANTDSLKNNTVFTQFFNGLHIRATPVTNDQREAGAVYDLDVVSGNTKISLHYHTSDTTPARTYELVMDEDAPWFHTLTRTETSDKLYGLTIPNTKDPDTEYQFMQEGLVLGIAVKVPHIRTLNPVGINRAELVLKVDDSFFGSGSRYTPPSEVYLYLADSTGLVPEDASLFSSFVSYNSTEKAYKIPLSNNIMRIIIGQLDNNGFVIYPGVPGLRGDKLNRVVLGGTGHPELAPELRVTYTTLPN